MEHDFSDYSEFLAINREQITSLHSFQWVTPIYPNWEFNWSIISKLQWRVLWSPLWIGSHNKSSEASRSPKNFNNPQKHYDSICGSLCGRSQDHEALLLDSFEKLSEFGITRAVEFVWGGWCSDPRYCWSAESKSRLLQIGFGHGLRWGLGSSGAYL